MAVSLRYAETDDDVIAIHQFLLLVASPVLHCQVDQRKAIEEIHRIMREDVAIMAMLDDKLIGTLGLLKATWWYGSGPDAEFMTDRWFFIVPTMKGHGIGALLLADGAAIAHQSNHKLIINGHMRARAKAVGSGVLFTRPLVIEPGCTVDPAEAEKYADFGGTSDVLRQHDDKDSRHH